jgi:protein-S-isoprenylcysteine O-methyltransferase Ste14
MNELVFRLAALAAAITFFGIRNVWERRLGKRPKAEQVRQVPSRERLAIYATGFGLWPMWLYMLSPLVDFARIGLPTWARFAGLGAALAGILMLFLSHRDLAASWSAFVEAPAGGLVTRGVYRLVRHPMYASFFLFTGGMLLLTSNWLAGAPAVLGMLWLYLERVDGEERMMLDLFGDEYRVYAERTGRIVPGTPRRLAGRPVPAFAGDVRPFASGNHSRVR